MASTRRNIWELGSDWADPILWYARGVKAYIKWLTLADITVPIADMIAVRPTRGQ